ncbi:Acf4p [Saccharomyces cerevisiae x Saccharomyces kudriavzevii VIN7]|uniref:Acf4p n=1 Tax=Saccharomyces cerevisiae x Saccharomyces kudriavzevii (strain VIN7) TaxID=1095631 RepID=H0GX28_SACCK|nr:Acf4p [Saccharomyces cerevisiae x Saccharomyces kudriavzevii VIN7]
MSEDQRVVSQPIELHKLSIVDKHSQGQQQQQQQDQPMQSGSQSPRVATPLKPKRLAIPISSPQRSIATHSPVSDHQSPISTDQDLIYKLAAKHREINELSFKLQVAQKELKQLELQFKDTLPQNEQQKLGNQNTNEYLSTFTRKIQQTLVDVNNSPNVLKSKKSINEFFTKPSRSTNNNVNSIIPNRRPNYSPNRSQPVPNMAPNRPSELKSRPIPPPLPSRNARTNINTAATADNNAPFLQKILNKFNQMSMEEEEFDDLLEKGKSKKDNYYIKENMGYEYDEVRSDDEDDEEFQPMGDIPIHLFRR